jgi:hypothetical protein
MPIPSNLPVYADICEEEDNEGDIVVKNRIDDLDKIIINSDILYNDDTDSDEVHDVHDIRSERGHTRARDTRCFISNSVALK